MQALLILIFFACSENSGTQYSLSLDGEIVVKEVSYEDVQEHLRKYPEHDYHVYSDSLGEWKPWKEVIDLNAKPQNTSAKGVGSQAKEMISGLFESDEKYSLSLDGEIVVKEASYEDLQAHLRQYSEHDYHVYSDSLGGWKPWKEVIDLNAKPQDSKTAVSEAKEESSSFTDLLSMPAFLSGGTKLELPVQKDPFLTTAIPAGSYTMGCNFNEGDSCLREYVLDAHEVKISQDFEIMNTAITLGTYRELMGEYPAEILEKRTQIAFNSGYIAEVSKSKAIQFANALSKKQGLEECYSQTEEKIPYTGAISSNSFYYWLKGVDCKGWRLPTEAEWEYVYNHFGFKKLSPSVQKNYCSKLGKKIEPTHSRCDKNAINLQHLWQQDDFLMAGACEHVWDAYLTNNYKCDDNDPHTKLEPEKTCRRYPLYNGTVTDPIFSYRYGRSVDKFSPNEWSWTYDKKPDDRKLEVIKTIKTGKERVVGSFGRALPIHTTAFYKRCTGSAIRLVRRK